MHKIVLDEKEIPKKWYNINPDLPSPLPSPKTLKAEKTLKTSLRFFQRVFLSRKCPWKDG